MIRQLFPAVLAALWLVLPAQAEPQRLSDAQRLESTRNVVPGHVKELAGNPAGVRFLKSLETFIQESYRKRETVLDGTDGQAYLKQQQESVSTTATDAASTTASLPTPTAPRNDPLGDFEGELAAASSDPTAGGGTARRTPSGAVSGEAFRATVTSFDDVKAFIVARLYSDAEKLGGKASGGAPARGLDPLFFVQSIGPASLRLKSPLLTDLSNFFTSEAMRPQLGAFVEAFASQGEEPKRALALLDAYVKFRKASRTEAARKTAVTAASTRAQKLAQAYLFGKIECRGCNETDRVNTGYLWLHQEGLLTATAKGKEAAASVYAWLADAIVVMDVLNLPQNQRRGTGSGENSMPAEEFTRRLDSLDGYVGKVRERQRKLAQALLEFGKLTKPEERRAKAMEIKELYAGTNSRPLPLMIADIDDSPNVGRLAGGVPAGTDEATRSRHDRLFNQETGTIQVLHVTENALEERMIRAGFRNLVLDTREAVASQREERAPAGGSRGRRRGPGAPEGEDEELLAGGGAEGEGRRRKQDGDEREGSGGAGRGTMDFLRGIGGAAGPVTEAIVQANAQRDAVEADERRQQSAQQREDFLRSQSDTLRQEQLDTAEANAAVTDRNADTIEGAQRSMDQQREKERQEAIAFEERQRQLAQERLLEEQRRKAAAAQEQAQRAAAQAGTAQAGTAAGTVAGPQTGAGGPGAPATSRGIPQGAAAAAPGGGAVSANTVLSDAQIVEVARTKVPVTANSYGIEPGVLSDSEIQAVLDPLISAKVAQFNQELTSKRMTVNADLQYSGPGIQTTGLPVNHERHAMWLGRFPEMGAAASQAAQARYDQLLQEQVRTLSAARQAAVQRQQATSPVAVAQTPQAPVATTPAPIVVPPVVRPLTTTAEPGRTAPPESAEMVLARKVIVDFDKRAGAPSGIDPKSFLDGLARFNATNPRRLDISLPSLVQLVKVGLVTSRVPAPVLPIDLGPDGEAAQRAIDEFDRRANGKSGILPADFLRARDKVNATNPVKIELSVDGLIRLINQRQLVSKVPVPVAASGSGPGAPLDDGRFGPVSGGQ